MNSKMKKLLVNAAMAGMIAGAGVMVPASGSANTPSEVSQNSCGGKDGWAVRVPRSPLHHCSSTVPERECLLTMVQW